MSSGIEVALARALTTTAIFLFLETPVPPGSKTDKAIDPCSSQHRKSPPPQPLRAD